MFDKLRSFFKRDKKQKPLEIPLGTKVIVRSNEPEPLMVGFIKEYVGKDDRRKIPIVIDAITGEEFWCFGIVRPYSKELYHTLNTMVSIEQYNYLAHRHSQIETKYGISYKTYECQCEACIENAELEKDFE
jgi:hypothetical protein